MLTRRPRMLRPFGKGAGGDSFQFKEPDFLTFGLFLYRPGVLTIPRSCSLLNCSYSTVRSIAGMSSFSFTILSTSAGIITALGGQIVKGFVIARAFLQTQRAGKLFQRLRRRRGQHVGFHVAVIRGLHADLPGEFAQAQVERQPLFLQELTKGRWHRKLRFD